MSQASLVGEATLGSTKWSALTKWLGPAVLAVLLITSVTSPKPPTYDEPWYLGTVALLREHGLSARFLQELPGPAGPTYTLVFGTIGAVVGLQPPGLRLINVLLLGGVIWAVYTSLKLLQTRSGWQRNDGFGAWLMLALPTTWVLGGLALTEMPSMAFAALGMLLLCSQITTQKQQLWVFAFAGLAFGMAAIGRQPLLAYVLAIPLLTWKRVISPVQSLVLLVAALLLPSIVFGEWGGLVPPRTQYVQGRLRLDHAVLAAGYLGLCTLLIAPRFFQVGRRFLLVACAVGAVLGVVVQLAGLPDITPSITPLRTTVSLLLPKAALPIYKVVVSTVLSAAAVVVTAVYVRRAWDERHDGLKLYCIATIYAVVLACANVSHLFSSRYVGQVTPLAVLLLSAYGRRHRTDSALAIVGAIFGFSSLIMYLYVVQPRKKLRNVPSAREGIAVVEPFRCLTGPGQDCHWKLDPLRAEVAEGLALRGERRPPACTAQSRAVNENPRRHI